MPTITIKSAIINFANTDPLSKVQITGGYDGVTPSALASDFTITVTIQDNRPGGQTATLQFAPTRVQ